MNYSSEVNYIQSHIMHRLFTHESLRFSQINTLDVPSDQFSYHLRQLLKYGVVEKTPDNRYRLSVEGRTRAIMLDSKSNRFIQQGFVACRILVSRIENGTTQYLMQKRARVPFLGYIGEPGGKILFGEDVLAAAARNLLLETGLQGELSLRGICHFKDIYRGDTVQDKYFFVIRAANCTGELLPSGPTGENTWMSLEDIATHPYTYQGVTEMIRMAEQKEIEFLEEAHTVGEY